MNELIPITINENQEPICSGRDLHNFLEVKTEYAKWFDRMKEYGFADELDFSSILSESTGGRPSTDHAIKLDMAKELAMLQRNDKGKQARQYFIRIEKDWNSPEKIMARALKIAEQKLSFLQIEVAQKNQLIGELKPKADYTDKILQSKGTVTITAIAKDYGMTGTAFNKLLHELKVQYKQGDIWLLYREHQAKGYTHSKTFDYLDSRGNPQTRMQTQWTQKGRLFLYELLKKNGILPMIERNELLAI